MRDNRQSNSNRTGGPDLRTRLMLCMIGYLVLLCICLGGTLLLYQKQDQVPQVELDLTFLDSPYAALIDRTSGTVLASRRGDEVIYPASMTKIMTVWTAIEQIRDLDDTVTMDASIYDALYADNASQAGFEPGESVRIRDLLYGAILPSGAECCVQLAVTAAGSEDAFVELMNQKVSDLGLKQTHFVNTTGLHSEDQYSTAEEIALILRAALDNPVFRTVITTKSYTTTASDMHPDGFTVVSSMFKNLSDAQVTGGEILGGKTGYTGEAGHCLASFAEIEDREYILVTAGWAEDPRTDNYHINDAVLAYNALGSALLNS